MSRNEWTDPEGGGGLLDPDDPEGGGGLLDPDDPEGGGGLLDPDDPEGGGGLLDPDDPEGGGGLLDPDDPEGGGGLLDPDDPSARASRRQQAALRAAQLGRSGDRIRAENAGIPAPAQRYSGDVIVRLSSLLPLLETGNLGELATALRLPGLAAVLASFGSPPSSRAVTAPTAGAPGVAGSAQCEGKLGTGSLDDLERRAAQSTFRPLHSLWSYWRIDARNLNPTTDNHAQVPPENGLPLTNSAKAAELVKALNALSEVDQAYREFAASDPFVAPSAEELADFQFYLEDAPLGLDARWARTHLTDTDKKIALADLEQGWLGGHGDLSLPALAHGANRHGVGTYRGDHGTAVVSQLVAHEGNALGMVGIAAGAASLSLASHYRAGAGIEPGTNGHVADAIVALITGEKPVLGAGDVLLLEVQRAGQPTEVDPLDLEAIRLAVASGIIVVEPAGNGRINLNRLRTVDGRVMRRRSVDFVDSGAIVVGAARSALPHNRAWYSNHGSRVDCFAWGDSVVAAGYGSFLGGADEDLFTGTFSGTSSAAPMIAGAAVLVQSLYRQNAGSKAGAADERWKRLSPGQMRALLSDRRTGTRQGRGVGGRIGVMPSLRAVLGRSLGIAPDPYLRDHVGDSGGATGRRFCSPDIIVTKVASSKLDETFGESGLFADRDIFDAGLASLGKKRICVRSCNRGLLAAKEMQARIYRAPVCTLVTPDRWHELSGAAAAVPIGDVPRGDTFAVSAALEHTGEENSSLVAVVEPVGEDDGPAPCRRSSFDWIRYLRAMRRQRNVAVRNVHAVEVRGSDVLELSFAINGTSDAPRSFEFELIQKLPAGVDLELKTHLALALKLARGRLWNVTRRDVTPGSAEAVLRLPRQPRLPLGVTPLPAAVDFASTLIVRGAKAIRPGHSLAIRQIYRGEEVGRITWRFVGSE